MNRRAEVNVKTTIGSFVRAGLLAAGLGACAGGDGTLTVWTFDEDVEGFVVDQTDFHPDTRGDLDAAITDLPAPLTGRGLQLVTMNRSDDQWVYATRGLDAEHGVAPSTLYDATITLRFATSTPTGCVGVGGAPDAVTIKAGVVDRAPEHVTLDEGYIGFSIDKGDQSQIGSEAVDLGLISGSSTDCAGQPPWELVTRTGEMRATSDAEGRLWIYVGTDSGFESGFTLYLDELTLELTPR